MSITIVKLTGYTNSGSSTAAPSESSAPSESTAPSESSAPASESGRPTRGTLNGNVYHNDFSGITFTAPEGWTYSDDQAIADLMGVGAEVLKDSGVNYNEKLLELQSVYDMMCTGTDGSNVIGMFENLAVSLATGMAVEDYLDSVAEQLAGLNMGYSEGEISDVQLGGTSYKMMTMESTAGFTQSYLVAKSGNYMNIIIITAAGGTDIDTIMECFS